MIVDNVFEIFHPDGYGYGSFIFTNDSTFYYVPYSEEYAKGVFTIRNMIVGRPPILRYYSEHSPMEKITLFLDGYNAYYKALFIPDSNIVISNYGALENEMIQQILTKKKNKVNTFDLDKKQIIIYILLFISVLINIWFLFRKR